MPLVKQDRGYEALLKTVFGLGNPQVLVGILAGDVPKKGAGAGEAEPVTLLEVAQWMEFGTDTIPERSFIRKWFDEASPRMREELGRLCLEVLKGRKTKEQILNLLGQRAVGEIQKRISDGIPPELAPSTIDAKGSTVPLIDTGQLRSAITYKVRDQ